MRLLTIDNNQMGWAETLGVSRKISLRLVPDARIGNYLLVHAGFAAEGPGNVYLRTRLGGTRRLKCYPVHLYPASAEYSSRYPIMDQLQAGL